MTETDLAARWTTPDGERLALEVFGRLLSRKRLDDLRLGAYDGRVDLRGISAPPPERLTGFAQKGWVVSELVGLLKFTGVRLTDLDFTGSRFSSHSNILPSEV